jgi:YD repeat-containing protein
VTSPAGDQAGIDYSDATPDVTYTYDRQGRRIGTTDASGTQTVSYTEDSQVDAIAHTGGPLDGVFLAHSYDTLGRAPPSRPRP